MSVAGTTLGAVSSAVAVPQQSILAAPSTPTAQRSHVSVGPVDTVVLSDRALQLLNDIDPGAHPPAPGASSADKLKYNHEISLVSDTLKRLDGITLSPDYQTFADIINKPNVSDDQKFEAYSKYRVESAISDSKYGSWSSSEQDFKFDYLTRHSTFIKNLNTNESPGLVTNEENKHRQNPTTYLRVPLIYDQRLLQTFLILLVQSLISRRKSAEHRLMQPNWFELPERTGQDWPATQF